MSIEEHKAGRDLIKVPGAEVTTIPKLDVKPIKSALRGGQYVIDQGVVSTFKTFQDNDVPKHCVEAIWQSDEVKGFRNAYSSCLVENMWPNYLASISGENTGKLSKMSFDDAGNSKLTDVNLDGMNSARKSIMLGALNEMMIDHYILEEFSDGKIPSITGDASLDRQYLEAFKLLTDVGRQYGIFRIGVPENTPSMGAFIIRGVRATRAQLFSLPNLITYKANESGTILTASEHRDAYVRSLRTAVSPYYLPTFPMVDALNNHVTTGGSGEVLNPNAFSATGDSSNFIVYVDPSIVTSLNAEFQAMDTKIQSQTSCPIYSGQIRDSGISAHLTPLPRSLSNAVLSQLDVHFYPTYHDELVKGNLADPIFKIE